MTISESQMRAWVRMLDALGIPKRGNIDLRGQAAFLNIVLLIGILMMELRR